MAQYLKKREARHRDMVDSYFKLINEAEKFGNKENSAALIIQKLGCLELNGSSMTKKEHHSKSKEYGGATSAVANSMNGNKMKISINKANSSQNKPK